MQGSPVWLKGSFKTKHCLLEFTHEM
uniref:Uncharacterized protein n=1 Tax=Anguilla anguilla TaxID=7936 RepID=A0A0E9W1L8_ANGAN